MYKLNLPAFDYKLKQEDGKVWIFDLIRKKFVVLTPEEWVRQHFVSYLIQEFNYPKALMRIETGLQYNTLSKRTDIVVYDRHGQPWMIVECKSPEVRLGDHALQQVATYNASLRAKYLTITNGMIYLCTSTDWHQMKTAVMNVLPPYPGE